jgi:hypothetical protein
VRRRHHKKQDYVLWRGWGHSTFLFLLLWTYREGQEPPHHGVIPRFTHSLAHLQHKVVPCAKPSPESQKIQTQPRSRALGRYRHFHNTTSSTSQVLLTGWCCPGTEAHLRVYAGGFLPATLPPSSPCTPASFPPLPVLFGAVAHSLRSFPSSQLKRTPLLQPDFYASHKTHRATFLSLAG